MRNHGLVVACLASFAATAALADPPDLKTPSPVIYLADNLDEADRLGWCIDTLGRGYAENLQTHSCKPQGGDVQFMFDTATRRIASVEFAGKCMEVIAPEAPRIAFGLRDCADELPAQQFAFDSETGQITPAGERETCVAAGAESRSAGPFMSRDLILAPCATTAPELITWVVRK